MMGISWGALAGAFLAPFLYGLYSKKITKAAVWSSFGFGVGVMVFNMLFKSILPDFFKSSINMGVIAMLGGLVIVPVVSIFTRKQNKDDLEAIFSCYEKTVTVSAKDSLGD